MTIKYEADSDPPETPRQRFWRKTLSAVYGLIALAVLAGVLLGFFNPMPGA